MAESDSGSVLTERKAYIVPFIQPSQQAPEGFTELFNAYWQAADQQLSGLEVRSGVVKRVFAEGVLGKGDDALQMFETALRLDEKTGKNPGVSLSEWGFAHLRLLHPRKALPLLEAGEAALRDSGKPGFHARALKKLVMGYRANLRFGKANKAQADLAPLIEKHGFFDQRA